MSDIDALALGQAYGDTNNAVPSNKKENKKRAREHQDGGGLLEVRQKKKKKSKDREVAHEAHAYVEPEGTAEQSVAALGLNVKEEKKKKKKRRQDKGKQRAEPMQEPVQVQHSTPAPAPAPHSVQENDFAASDFLSAVVAAASATSHIHAGPAGEYMPSPLPYHDPMAAYPSPTGEFPPFAPPMFHPGPDGIGLPDLTMLSSDYLLQTLQNLDITQIASVLKTLGENGSSLVLPSLNYAPSFVSGPQPPGPPPVKQTSAKSVSILGRHPKQVKASGQSTRSLPPPTLSPPAVAAGEDNPDHSYMLANVWMNASKLAQMAQTHGLVYKKGKFSATEEAQLNAAIERFKAGKGMSQQDLVDLVFSKDKGRGDTFWQEITAAVHARPIIAVYHHVRRRLDPLAKLGRWMASEDDSLRSAIQEFGQQWQKVSDCVGRSAADCRDRYRNHLENSSNRRSGAWSREEEEELTAIVNELKIQRGEVSDSEIFWGAVSQRMGGRRGRQQCRVKWLDSLSSRFKNEGMKPRWGQVDAYILVHKIDSLNVRDDSEIDWKTLPDEDWNMWSAHSLQRRWLTMKRSVKGFEDMSHAELMDILRTKKAQSPLPPVAPRGTKKNPRSAETIEDSDEEAGGRASESTQDLLELAA